MHQKNAIKTYEKYPNETPTSEKNEISTFELAQKRKHHASKRKRRF
jgi:hypothetical protein